MPLINAKRFLERFGTCDQAQSCVPATPEQSMRETFDRDLCTPLAYMVSVGQVQIVDASTRLLASIWFSQTRHLTFVPDLLSFAFLTSPVYSDIWCNAYAANGGIRYSFFEALASGIKASNILNGNAIAACGTAVKYSSGEICTKV